jgi:DNA segregation ATPase FtsK/SpoIIIE, S-DNA-T family
VLLRLAEATDYATIGVRGVDPSQLTPGRGFLAGGGTEIQVALPDETDLTAAVASLRWIGSPRTAPPIALLPNVVSMGDLMVRDSPSRPLDGWAIGLLDRTLGAAMLSLAPGDHALIAGPARSGKSSALALIARLATLDNAIVHVVASPRSPLARGTSRVVLTPDALGRLVDELLVTDLPPRHVIVVDDADLVDDGGHLERLLAAHPLHVHVVASARADRLRTAFRHWTVEVRRSRIGVLLRPDDIDGELLGVRLPRGGALPSICGRGYLVTEQGIEIVQVALLDAHGQAA